SDRRIRIVGVPDGHLDLGARYGAGMRHSHRSVVIAHVDRRLVPTGNDEERATTPRAWAGDAVHEPREGAEVDFDHVPILPRPPARRLTAWSPTAGPSTSRPAPRRPGRLRTARRGRRPRRGSGARRRPGRAA